MYIDIFFMENDYKQCYLIDKFCDNISNICNNLSSPEELNSNESNLFFIPPIHPYLLLFLRGEMWHARSKLPCISDSNQTIKGILNIEYYNQVPEFLKSKYKLKELHIKFNEFIINNRFEYIHKLANKYLKYKAKYLKLKFNM